MSTPHQTGKERNEASEIWDKLDNVFQVYSGGAVHWEDVADMEDIKPKDVTLYHCKKYRYGGYEQKILIVMVEEKIK